MQAVKEDFRQANIPPHEMAALEYAAKLNSNPGDMRKEDVDRLRSFNFTEQQILNINLVVCAFSYFNRIVDGLGVQLEPEFQSHYNQLQQEKRKDI